jgi:hypothetical protein
MYDISFNCRYYKDDVILPSDNVTEEEELFIRNYLYKEDLLNIFQIDYYSYESIFVTEIDQLYERIKSCSKLREIMKQISLQILLKKNEKNGLCLLYSYDYMYLTHKCVCEYLINRQITDESFNELKNRINNIL